MSESKTRILVVDDEERGVELLQRALRSLGPVDGAGSGEEAWERLCAESYDLVISDQRMPGMKGVELLTRVADSDPLIGRILLTGYADLDSTIQAINAGRVHAYVGKPCDPIQLKATVQGVLERISLGRQNASLVETLTVKNAALEEAVAHMREAQERAVRSEQLAAIGRTVAMIVHDLRGPISVMRSCGGAIASEGADLDASELRAMGSEILEEADRMERMCADLRETTQAGQGQGSFEEAMLSDVVHVALSAVGEEASRQGVEVQVEAECVVETPLDLVRMRRALLNLVYNALDAMPDGGVLRVEAVETADELRLSVIDSGVGIPESVRDRLFEPFVTAGKEKGTGLGLAVVHKVVEDHEGRIEVGKPEGGGTAIHLYLPRPDRRT